MTASPSNSQNETLNFALRVLDECITEEEKAMGLSARRSLLRGALLSAKSNRD